MTESSSWVNSYGTPSVSFGVLGHLVDKCAALDVSELQPTPVTASSASTHPGAAAGARQ